MTNISQKPSQINLPIAILAGGLATRLKPLTETIPKSLILIQGEPFIVHQLRLLKQRGLDTVVMCVGFLGEMIEKHVGNGHQFGLDVYYSYEHEGLLGTAGAIKQALPLLGESFFVLYGDSYLPCNYYAVQQAFRDSGQLALMTVLANQDRWDKSNVEFEQGKILAYDKVHPTPQMSYIDYGLGVFNRTVFDDVSLVEPTDLSTVYQAQLKNHQLAAFEVFERFYEIGSFSGIEETAQYIAKK